MTDLARIGRLLNMPWEWKVRLRERPDGSLVLKASGSDQYLICGHASVQVTAPDIGVAVAMMASRLEFHDRYCGETRERYIRPAPVIGRKLPPPGDLTAYLGVIPIAHD